LLIDESYYEFCHFSVIDMVKSHPNLIVTRSMSKAFGLAGLKVGYMIAGEAVLEAFSSLEIVLRPTAPSVYAAIEALKDTRYIEENVALVNGERERVGRQASDIGVEAYSSGTNFLLMDTHTPDAARKLKELGVMVCDVSRQISSEFIRVSIGNEKENDLFLSALKQIVSFDDTLDKPY
jgi:histidinol-phosphate aminotransferase